MRNRLDTLVGDTIKGDGSIFFICKEREGYEMEPSPFILRLKNDAPEVRNDSGVALPSLSGLRQFPRALTCAREQSARTAGPPGPQLRGVVSGKGKCSVTKEPKLT